MLSNLFIYSIVDESLLNFIIKVFFGSFYLEFLCQELPNQFPTHLALFSSAKEVNYCQLKM